MSKRATARTRTPITSRPSRHVRNAMERQAGQPKAASHQRRFARQLRDQGFVILALGEGKVDGDRTVPRALVMRPGQPAITVWAYGHGKWVIALNEELRLEADSFEEVEEWYYQQLIGPREKSDRLSEEEPEDRGFTYRDKRRVTA